MSTHIVFVAGENPPIFWTLGTNLKGEHYSCEGGCISHWNSTNEVVAWYYWDTISRELLDYTNLPNEKKVSGSLLNPFDKVIFKLVASNVNIDIKDNIIVNVSNLPTLTASDILNLRVLVGYRFTAEQLKKGGNLKPTHLPIHILGDGTISYLHKNKGRALGELPVAKVTVEKDPYYTSDSTITVECHLEE